MRFLSPQSVKGQRSMKNKTRMSLESCDEKESDGLVIVLACALLFSVALAICGISFYN